MDLALLTSGEAEVDVDEIRREVREALPGSALAERLSIFHVAFSRFASPQAPDRFPAIDRRDLMRSGVLVLGEDLRERFGVEPPGEEVLDHAISAALVRFTPAALRAEVDALTPESFDAPTTPKLVLWPVRLLHTIDTARAAGNDEAVAYYRELTGPPAEHLALAEAALAWRQTGVMEDRAGALAALRAELLPLYAEVYHRLRGRPDLPHTERIAARADQFTR